MPTLHDDPDWDLEQNEGDDPDQFDDETEGYPRPNECFEQDVPSETDDMDDMLYGTEICNRFTQTVVNWIRSKPKGFEGWKDRARKQSPEMFAVNYTAQFSHQNETLSGKLTMLALSFVNWDEVINDLLSTENEDPDEIPF